MQAEVTQLEPNKYLINFNNLSYFYFKGDENPPVLYLLKKKDPLVRLCDKCNCPIILQQYDKKIENIYIKDSTVNIQLDDYSIICLKLVPYSTYYRLVIHAPKNVRVVGTKIEEAFQIQHLGKKLSNIIKKVIQ